MVTSCNDDLLFIDWELYREFFGTSVYSFVVKSDGGEDLFISLDSSNGTLGKSQKEWFKRLLEDERSKYRHCVVYTHTNLYNTEGSQVGSGNYPIEETAWISNQLSKHKVDLMIMGHDHWGELYSFGGVNYIVLDALKDGVEKAGYLEIEIGEDISLNFVSIKKRE